MRLAQGRERVRHLSEATAEGSRQHNCVFCLCALQLSAKAESEASRLCLQNSLYQRCLTTCLSVKSPHTGEKKVFLLPLVAPLFREPGLKHSSEYAPCNVTKGTYSTPLKGKSEQLQPERPFHLPHRSPSCSYHLPNMRKVQQRTSFCDRFRNPDVFYWTSYPHRSLHLSVLLLTQSFC